MPKRPAVASSQGGSILTPKAVHLNVGLATYTHPGGTVQAKITTATLAKDMKFWAHMGNPSGEGFLAAPFFAAHPEYQWESPYLHDMPAYPWTLFSA